MTGCASECEIFLSDTLSHREKQTQRCEFIIMLTAGYGFSQCVSWR